MKDGLVPVLVDTTVFAKVLLERFEELMTRIKPRTKNSPNYEKWSELGLLQCMDLLMWEMLSGCGFKLPGGAVTSAVHSSVPQRDACRKTIIPLARELLSLNYHRHAEAVMTRLKADAALEVARREHAQYTKSRRSAGKNKGSFLPTIRKQT